MTHVAGRLRGPAHSTDWSDPCYQSIVDRLDPAYAASIDLSLDRVRRLLGALGNPHEKLPPVIHVAGTNGKGSVIAFLRAIYEAAGYRVHAYTSPHLVRFNERYVVAGQVIDNDTLLQTLREVEAANDGDPITFFEFATAAAFLIFSRHPADVVLLETGLGGTLDATNVVRNPATTVITPISYDHMNYLGSRLEQIAGEKAGVIKPGRPVVIGPQEKSVEHVIADHTRQLSAPSVLRSADWTIEERGEGVLFENRAVRWHLPRPGLLGAHQIENAGIALEVASGLASLPIGREHAFAGLRNVVWPARLQRLTAGRLPDILPPSWELWLDAAHNAGGARALGMVLSQWQDRSIHLICGMAADKDAATFLEALACRVAGVWAVPIPGSSMPPTDVTSVALALGLQSAVSDSVTAALQAIQAIEPRRSRAVICGSIYLAGWSLANN